MGDSDLVRDCVAGLEAAWSELVARYTGFVQAVVERTLRHHGSAPDAGDAEGLVAETFSALAEDDARLLVRYDPTYTLATYLRLIARSRTLSQLRRRRQEPRPLDDAAYAKAGDDSPEDLAVLEERRRLVAQAVERLPPRERVIVRLYHNEDLSYAEVAQMLDISINSVGPALSRATVRLREMLGRVEPGA